MGLVRISRKGTPSILGNKHKFDDGIWYSGKVISQVPGYPEWYNVVYDNDESIYLYQLRTNLEAGDLTIL